MGRYNKGQEMKAKEMKAIGWVIEEKDSTNPKSKWEAYFETTRQLKRLCIEEYEKENHFYTGVRNNYKKIRNAGNARIVKVYTEQKLGGLL